MSEWTIDRVDHIFIDRRVCETPVAKRAMALVAPEKIEWMDAEPLAERHGELSARDFDASKRLLFITEFKGKFFKRCPGARPGLTCCNYFVLNLGSQCNMNCSYCYLQSFINSPVMKIYANIETALGELREIANDIRDQPLRVGTGETTDSLSLDTLTLFSRRLIQFFREYPKWRLEFKTKSSQVEQFLDVEHAGNVIVSFSINPQVVVEREEHGTASLEKRLAAARECKNKKFEIAFHIDPMIWHPNWQNSYRELVRDICEKFKPDEVNVISVGALRFQPEQRHMMRERFADLSSWVAGAEMFPSADGKLRYDEQLRQEMLKFVVDEFRRHSREWRIFLCMETPETWLGAMQSMPKSLGNLSEMFDHGLTRKVLCQ